MKEKAANDDLKKKSEDLEVKARHLEEVNEALRSLLKQSKEDFRKFEQRIVANVEDLVLPYVKRMKDTSLDMDQQVYLNVIESNLTELVAPFMRRLGDKHANLTPREIEVANMVRMGSTSKEIAKLLNISKRAVEFHRDSLRRKLGLKKSKRNLRAYLASLG
jgi:DNA-binding NarL/FixJ family response regulator